jgi:N-hydroxyarylamine O-acetyltransferase
MYEELYEPFSETQKAAYLARIGVTDAVHPDRESLDRLIFAHQCAIPFENLDICELGKTIALGTRAIYTKLVEQWRGGYCFELNAAFYRLLEACGFTVTAHLARVLKQAGPANPPHHRVTLVHIDGTAYFCDVGFGGPMPGAALVFSLGAEQQAPDAAYCFRREGEYWMSLWRKTETGSTARIAVCTVPQEPVDFLGPNEYCFRSPLSFFSTNRLVNIRRKEGAASLTNGLFTRYASGSRHERHIKTRRELDDLLKTEFGIDLPLVKQADISGR